MSLLNGPNLSAEMEDLTLRIKQVTTRIRSEPGALSSLNAERMGLMEAAQGLLDATRQPVDQLMDAMATMAQLTALRLFIEWGVLDALPSDGSMTFKDIATKLDANVDLITRMAGILIAFGFLENDGQDSLSHTGSSKMFRSASPLSALLRNGFDDHLRSMSIMPEYFRKFGLRDPSGRRQTIYAFAGGDTELTVWEHMNRDPARMNNFMISMVAMGSRLPMVGSYDFTWILAEASKSDDKALVIDVGGGKGHALKAIFDATPGLPIERCAVEDLDVVVEEAKAQAEGAMSRAQYIAMDFHEEQPVKGALVYYIRRCLHDYGDEDAVIMLQRISDAMAADSRLLIVEQILSSPPSKLAAATDLIMATLGGKERTLESFKTITARAGLDIKALFSSEGSDVAVIECVRI